MKIANGLEMLELSAVVIGRQDFIYPCLFYDEKELILVDTGFPGLLKEFKDAIATSGHSLGQLTKIILTHHDIDHVGCLKGILQEITQKPVVLAHPDEKPYIEGSKMPVKLAGLEANLDNLPEQMKSLYNSMKSFYDNNRIQVDELLSDGQELPYCGGIVVIAAPGHTPGHTCLYHKPSKTLIAGDALSIEEGSLIASPARINYNQEQAKESLKKFTQYDIERVICYHGGLYEGNVNQQLLELAKA